MTITVSWPVGVLGAALLERPPHHRGVSFSSIRIAKLFAIPAASCRRRTVPPMSLGVSPASWSSWEVPSCSSVVHPPGGVHPVGLMAVAYFYGHAGGGFWPVLNGGAPAVIFCFVWLYISRPGRVRGASTRSGSAGRTRESMKNAQY